MICIDNVLGTICDQQVLCGEWCGSVSLVDDSLRALNSCADFTAGSGDNISPKIKTRDRDVNTDVWVYYLGLAQHIWVYGILRTMSSVNRAVILCGFAVYSIVLYLFGLLLHKIVWPKRRVDAWPQQWSPDEISIGQLEFENFRVRQGLIR
ncbi:unnamed protein product [Medioppia subpectinata]|uniref:Uncharacterized protein n=1 Tax=Medioppia subpectinata TaxID=1979941 RepID=A0A7R9PWV6_9ACAR|nr:unnamed protein product [Medioppia subpectinata]CAG2104349.1 unnamed protein product [Medioppia subpectinata]